MKAWVCRGAATLALAASCALPVSAQTAPLQSVPTLDVARYMGRWYEIANYPNRFQKECVRDTTATYRQIDAEHIEVTNQCTHADGKADTAVAEARSADAPARLKVRFAPAWLSWLPWVWGDYWVIELADDYRYAIVGTPSREYLWILSRTPTLAPADEQAVLAALPKHGYDPARLVRTPQSAP
jgi:apolipoprotein D and lipocalin family protein